MKAMTSNFTTRHEQGHEVCVLTSDCVELEVVPELGAKIISLKDLRSGREWLWHPPHGRKLFRNHHGDDFFRSPLVGIDECFPTIAPCVWQGRHLPDHGELWNLPWTVDETLLGSGVLKTTAFTNLSPFEFTRTIELHQNEVRLEYQLTNRGPARERFMWAIHPLLRLQPGDQLDLPGPTRTLFNGETWVDAIASAVPQNHCAKIFATPVSEGWAAVHNPQTGDRLQIEWDPEENNTLGLWLTRGGWHGHDHFAIEPTNSGADDLSAAAARNQCGALAAQESKSWQLCFRLGT